VNAVAAQPAPSASSRTSRHRVLVVVDEACASPDLCAGVRDHVGKGSIEALVIAPAHGSAATQWYVDEDAARADATRRLRASVACLARGDIRAHGRLADPDPVQAIADALHEFSADEILIITAPQRPSSWLHQNVIDRARRNFQQPIEHLVMAATPVRRSP
jgi:GABA permease